MHNTVPTAVLLCGQTLSYNITNHALFLQLTFAFFNYAKLTIILSVLNNTLRKTALAFLSVLFSLSVIEEHRI